MIHISLVLATVRRTDELQYFLASLHAQTYRGFELIVVDQNPDDRLFPVLAPYVDEFPITRLRTESRGLSRARNLGLKHISGDIVAFPDDDCRYPPGLLAAVAQFFVNHPKRDGLTGRPTDVDGNPVMGRLDSKPGFLDRINVWRRGIEFAIFLRRECIQETWFDEELGVGAGTAWGAGEGTDYLLRLLDGGASLYYDPDLAVVHPSHVPPYSDRAARRAYAYGCGVGRVLQKHRLPLWFKIKWLIRPLTGAGLSLVSLKVSEAEYRWNTFKGRLIGLLAWVPEL